MTLYRNALRAFNVRHVYAPKLAAPRFYTSLGDGSPATSGDGEIPNSTSVRDTGHASHGDPRRQEAKEVKTDFRSQLADKIRPLMRKQPHGLAAVVAPSEFPPSPIKSTPASRSKVNKLPDSKSGLLVSSLNTVTLFPIPYISFNIKTPSATYHLIRHYGAFTVSGLDDSATASAFAAKDEAQQRVESRTWWGCFVDQKGRVKSDCGGTWWMNCKFHSGLSKRVGDHVIVVAEVLDVGSLREEGPGGVLADASPGEKDLAGGLVYLDGDYRYVGNRMPMVTKRFSKTFRLENGMTTNPTREPVEETGAKHRNLERDTHDSDKQGVTSSGEQGKTKQSTARPIFRYHHGLH